jgi:isopenicillin N synthase-like dioxygenase
VPDTSTLNQADPIAGPIDDIIVVDRAALDGPSDDTIALIRSACRDTGYFCIDPDARQRECIDAALGRMRDFFALQDSDPRKLAVRQQDGRNGWCPRFHEPAYQPDTISTLEAYDFGREEVASPSATWPSVAGFREAAIACWESFHDTAARSLQVLAAAAGLDAGYFARRCDSRELNSMRLLHYAAERPVPDERNVGISAHTDFECITLLFQDTPGLELRSVDGRWLDAGASVGRIVVMLDDMLERWTNGHFSATGHRVRETEEQRFSIVLFVAVNDEEIVAPLKPFVCGDRYAKYEPVTQAEHLEAEVRRARKNAERLKG